MRRYYWGNKESISFECIKEITKALRKEFKGIQSNSYGYCCCTDYDAYHNYKNESDYVCAKIFKGGLNNDYHYGEFDLGSEVWFMWRLTEFSLADVVKVIRSITDKYNYSVVQPVNESECISISLINYRR